MKEEVNAYLKELAEVSKKHGLFISSCECCSKIYDIEGNEIESLYGIGYDDDTDSY